MGDKKPLSAGLSLGVLLDPAVLAGVVARATPAPLAPAPAPASGATPVASGEALELAAEQAAMRAARTMLDAFAAGRAQQAGVDAGAGASLGVIVPVQFPPVETRPPHVENGLSVSSTIYRDERSGATLFELQILRELGGAHVDGVIGRLRGWTMIAVNEYGGYSVIENRVSYRGLGSDVPLVTTTVTHFAPNHRRVGKTERMDPRPWGETGDPPIRAPEPPAAPDAGAAPPTPTPTRFGAPDPSGAGQGTAPRKFEKQPNQNIGNVNAGAASKPPEKPDKPAEAPRSEAKPKEPPAASDDPPKEKEPKAGALDRLTPRDDGVGEGVVLGMDCNPVTGFCTMHKLSTRVNRSMPGRHGEPVGPEGGPLLEIPEHGLAVNPDPCRLAGPPEFEAPEALRDGVGPGARPPKP